MAGRRYYNIRLVVNRDVGDCTIFKFHINTFKFIFLQIEDEVGIPLPNLIIETISNNFQNVYKLLLVMIGSYLTKLMAVKKLLATVRESN